MPRDPRTRLVIAFAALYTIWGSTYLAIRVAIETIPPFTMVAIRFLVAGLVLYAWARRRGAPRPTLRQWRSAALVGTLLLLLGNGGVTWSETRVTSGIAALMVGAEPLWAAIVDWARRGGRRPSLGVGVGLATGFAGVALLVAPGELGGRGIDPVAAAVLLVATIGWAIGSVASRHADTPHAPMMATGINMIAGSGALWVAAAVSGGLSSFHPAAVTLRSALALAYLIVFGSVVAFTAYIWLLRHVSVAKASTYAYVNPVVAVFLGWLLLGEPVTERTLIAAAVIIAGVVLISTLPLLGARRQPVAELAPQAD